MDVATHSQITTVSDWPRLFCTLGVLFSIAIAIAYAILLKCENVCDIDRFQQSSYMASISVLNIHKQTVIFNTTITPANYSYIQCANY